MIILVGGSASTVHAHGLALPFAFWGGFSPAAAYCQRIIALAADRCGGAVWKVRSACLGALVDGGACDVTGADNAVQQAHLNALNVIDLQCTSPEAQALNFLLKYEAQTDMNVFCTALEAATVSAVYGPVTVQGIVRSVDATTRHCVDVTQRGATRLLRFAFRERRRALDTAATVQVCDPPGENCTSLPPTDKQALVNRSTARIERARAALAVRVEAACPTFESVYHRSADVVLENLASRADCLAGATYVQNAVVCPASVCGNGMVEAGEQCDDGNTTDGDGCSSTCMIESPSGAAASASLRKAGP